MATLRRVIGSTLVLSLLIGLLVMGVAGAQSAQADLALTMTGPGSAAIAGGSIQYNLSVANLGTSQAVNVSLQVTLPALTSFVSVTPSADCSHTSGVLTCTSLVLDVGANIAYQVTVDVAPEARANLVALGAVTSSITDPVTTNNNRSVTTSVNTEVNLGVAIASMTPNPPIAGAALTYDLQLTNTGRSLATGTQLIVTLPTNRIAEFVSATPGFGCSGTTATITCTIGNVAPAGVNRPGWITSGSVLSITVIPKSNLPAAEPLLTTVTIQATEADQSAPNNFASQQNPVALQSDLGVAITGTSGTQQTTSAASYTVTVSNNGPSDNQNVQLVVTIPTQMIEGVQITGSGCTLVGTTLTCSIGTMVANATATFQIDGTLLTVEPSTATLTATVSGSVAEPPSPLFVNSTSASVDVLPFELLLPMMTY